MKLEEHIEEAFANHAIKKIPMTFAWRCAEPKRSHYHFYVSWAPGMLTVGGDINELVVRYYSFSDPWLAAAWVNGAGWDYFMEKACTKTEYDAAASAENIVRDAYEYHRADCVGQPSGCSLKRFQKIVDEFGEYGQDDPKNPEHRKQACRRIMSYAESGELSPEKVYEITEDSEMIIYRYPESWRWQYAAFKLWAKWMWENEPLWHKAIRQWWKVQAARKRFNSIRQGAYWHPIKYAEFLKGSNTYREASTTSQVYHVFRAGRDGGFFIPIVPLKAFGRTWDHLGLWERTYNSQKDDIVTSPSRWQQPHTFRDIRPGDFQV